MQDTEQKNENNIINLPIDTVAKDAVTTKKYHAIYLSNIVAIPRISLTCDINNEQDVESITQALDKNEPIVVLASLKYSEAPEIEDYLDVACIAVINRVTPQPNGLRAILTGQERVEVVSISSENGLMATVKPLQDVNGDTIRAYQFVEEIRQKIRSLSAERMFGPLQTAIMEDEISPANFSELLFHFLVKQDKETMCVYLAESNVEKRLALVSRLLDIYITNMRTRKEIEDKVNENLTKTQKEIFLREQLHVINEELNGEVDEVEDLTNKVKALGMPKDSEEKVLKEVNRLGKLPFGSPEIGYIRNFIDTVIELPWTKKTKDNIDIKKAREVLNADHYALDDVKERILETLAVVKLTGKVNAQIICLVGPPGVGKTSIAKSIARAMGREFVQVSLGGVSDESVIRGHRRTYVGAMCGRILAGMKQAGTINPVFLLDEIDKLTRDARGDPASALLEVLDPAQNDHFKDNFLEIPYDLSQVMFILTANYLEGIPEPLRDRMEIISLRSYTEIEKLHIAKNYLIPKQEKLAGIPAGTVKLDDSLLRQIINEYTFEGGVRSLERKIAEICRKYASFIVSGEKFKDISKDNIVDYLGHERIRDLDVYKGGNVGEVVGLSVVGNVTGGLLLIESALSVGKGELLLTGQPGKMMLESSKIAHSLIKSRAESWGIPIKKITENNIHLSIPNKSGVEGPSAGIAMTTAMVSTLTDISVKKGLAMTGEISLSGRVFPVGGIRDKLMAAERGGIKECIIPKDNEEDLWEIPAEVKDNLKIYTVANIDEVLKIALVKPLTPAKSTTKQKSKQSTKKDESK